MAWRQSFPSPQDTVHEAGPKKRGEGSTVGGRNGQTKGGILFGDLGEKKTFWACFYGRKTLMVSLDR